MVITEFLKYRYNQGKSNNLYFWRNNMGNEVDLIFDSSNRRLPIEIKSGQTVSSEYLKGINYWHKISGNMGGLVIYDGKTIQQRSNDISIIPLLEITAIFNKIEG
jgi:hypothetical protein